jgi:hypothetical protein
VRHFFEKVEVVLYVTAAVAALGLHAGTFVTTIRPIWVFPVFLLLLTGVLCSSKLDRYVKRSPWPSKPAKVVVAALILYAILTGIYDHKATGGMTSVSSKHGQYFREDKGIETPITEEQYWLFARLMTRSVSAVLAMMAAFGLMNIWQAAHLSNLRE